MTLNIAIHAGPVFDQIACTSVRVCTAMATLADSEPRIIDPSSEDYMKPGVMRFPPSEIIKCLKSALLHAIIQITPARFNDPPRRFHH